jgi:HD-GYP domain-containing protein (c-di-GMP phosphodiesterase class II)
MLRSVQDVAATFRTHPSFADLGAPRVGDSYLELTIGPVQLVLCWPRLWRDPARLAPHLKRARSGGYPLVLMGEHDDFHAGRVHEIDDPPGLTVQAVPMTVEELAVMVRSQRSIAEQTHAMARRDIDFERTRFEVEMLIAVGRDLSRERDLDSLLSRTLQRAREVTGADAGSVYVVEGNHEEVRNNTLRFKVTQNDSVAIESAGFTLPVSVHSIVGTCVLTRQAINIPDLYALSAPDTVENPWGFRHDRSFDEKHRYQTRSMLTVPMISARNQVIGVIQLINKRGKGVGALDIEADFASQVVPFDDASVELAQALASQAGIALENALLYDEVRRLFEGFVRASVTAIEARDPTTSGHSQRVADLTVGLAKVVDRVDTGPFAQLRFSYDDLKQIEYASLLHDFGKVGVREDVLVKAKKLYPHQKDLILARFDFVRKVIEAEQLATKVTYLIEASRDQAAAELERLDRDAGLRLREIDEFLEFVLKANEPTVLEQGGFERLVEIAARRYRDVRGEERPYLTEAEVQALQIARGSLTEPERRAIEQHVVHTYAFLKQIPWGRIYKDIPEIAGAHHEKLDGTGYPKRTRQIMPQARMMTIADIFDALTASDRPYKKAVPLDKALDILGYEVKAGKLDAALFDLFLAAKVYEVAVPARS